MRKRKWFEIGGIAAGVVLILFGLGALALSVNGRSDVQSASSGEQIVGLRRHDARADHEGGSL